jgi:hypothetical protein
MPLSLPTTKSAGMWTFPLLCVILDPVRTLALLVRRWSAMIRASGGQSHDLRHRRRAHPVVHPAPPELPLR